MCQAKTILLLMIIVGVVSSCRLPLEIKGQGDITTLSGAHGCSFDQFRAGNPVCTDNKVIDQPYDETFVATTPYAGWVFKGWRTYCPYNNLSNECRFELSAATVAAAAGLTRWPLRAEFIPDCTGDPTCTVSIAPILGAVTDTSIKIWQATLDDAVFQVHHRLPGATLWNVSTLVTLDEASGFAGTVELTGLQAGTRYEYKTFLNGIEKTVSTFSTLPSTSTPGFDGQVRFGMANDLMHYEQPFLALGQAVTKDLDFMLVIGDLMYADVHKDIVENNPTAYRGRYWNTWDESNFAALSTTTPMFMMWDDHEIINDFFPGKHLLSGAQDRYPAARAAYDSYVHSHNPDTTGDVLYYSFSVPGADFFVLDTRTYRSSGDDADNEDKTMLGDVQLNALLSYLESRQGVLTEGFKFIVTSVPFSLGEASSDTWSSYQTEREYILSEIEARGITNVAFLSGDRHFSGIYRIISPGGYVYYDFLPSPTGAPNRTAPAGNAHPREEEVIYTSDTFKVFGDFQLDLSGSTPTLRVAFVDDNGIDRCVVTIGNDETGVVMPTEPAATCELGPPVLSVSGKTETGITLAWNDVSAEAGYSLRRSTSASAVLDAASEIDQLGADVTAYTDINLIPDTTYYYQLVALNATRESASVIVSAKTLIPAGCN